MISTVTLLLNARHAEYSPAGDDITVEYHADDHAGLPDHKPITDALWERATTGFDDDREWVTLIIATGTPAALSAALDRLMADLAERPTGDDTVYDYWPSGILLAGQMAADLDQIDHTVRRQDALDKLLEDARDAGVPTAADLLEQLP